MKNATSSSSVERAPHDGLQPGLTQPEIGAHRGGVIVVELGELRLEPGGDRDGGRTGGRGVLGDRLRDLVAALLDVGDEQHRLGGERGEERHRVGRIGGWWDRTGGTAGLERLDHVVQPCRLGDRVAVAGLGRLSDSVAAALGLLEVGVDEFGLDRVHVGDGVDAPVRMHDIRVLMGTDDVDDRVGLPDVGEELVAEPFALVGAGDETGNVVELDRVRDDLRRLDGVRDRVEPLVGHRDDGDVWLDRRERVVGGFDGDAGERAKQRRLAGVRHPDDPDLHDASSPTSVPSAAPARTSLG